MAARQRGDRLSAEAAGWPGEPGLARAMQERLRRRVVETDELAPLRRIAGVDVHVEPARGLAFAAAVLLDASSLELVESAMAVRPVTFPYVPGYLSFREAPAALAALRLLAEPPDLLLCDGQGRAHPRRFGLACHIGVLADLPTIGVAKSRLIGRHDEPGPGRGDTAPLEDKGELIGAVLRTRRGVRPLWISVGHKVSLATAVALVGRLTTRYRLPEPTRLADRLSRAHRGAAGSDP
jgi:deoxyribonuclease V